MRSGPTRPAILLPTKIDRDLDRWSRWVRAKVRVEVRADGVTLVTLATPADIF
jgi:hypothetical protein